MNLNDRQIIYGVHSGVQIGQQDRTDELNNRIAERYFPDTQLQPNFDPRPVPTKYSLFPIVDRRTISTQRVLPNLEYYPEVIFNPGNARGPVSGVLNNIEIEATLRNMTTPLHKGDLGIKYIPSLHSELYNATVNPNAVPNPEHALLFEKPIFENTIHPNLQPNVGRDLFFNHTRTQLRNNQ